MTDARINNMTRTVWIENEPEPSLEWLQETIGGYVEKIDLPDGSQLIVDEDGRMKQSDPNDTASLLAERPIVGNAVVLIGESRLT